MIKNDKLCLDVFVEKGSFVVSLDDGEYMVVKKCPAVDVLVRALSNPSHYNVSVIDNRFD